MQICSQRLWNSCLQGWHGWAQQCLQLLKDKPVGEWPLLCGHNAALSQHWEKRKIVMKRPNASYTLGKRRTRDDLSLDIRHELVVAQVRPVFTYWQAPNYTQPEFLHLTLIKSCHKCFRLCWQRSGQEGGLCTGFQERSIVQNWVYSFQRSLLKIGNYGFFWLCNWLC